MVSGHWLCPVYVKQNNPDMRNHICGNHVGALRIASGSVPMQKLVVVHRHQLMGKEIAEDSRSLDGFDGRGVITNGFGHIRWFRQCPNLLDELWIKGQA